MHGSTCSKVLLVILLVILMLFVQFLALFKAIDFCSMHELIITIYKYIHHNHVAVVEILTAL